MLTSHFQTSLVMSVYLTISLSLDRYLTVVHPLLTLQHSSMCSCMYLSIPAITFSVLFTLPNYFILKTEMDNQITDNITAQDLMGNDSLLGRYYDSLLLPSHDSLLGSNYDSLLESSWLQDVSQPNNQRLVWATWRSNQAFSTVSLDTVMPCTVYLIPGIRVVVAPHLRHHHPPHLAHLAQQDYP